LSLIYTSVPSRGREEREKFTANKKIANGLNESAKESDSPFSYSVRDNLEISKFERKLMVSGLESKTGNSQRGRKTEEAQPGKARLQRDE
jgi:hypothetical protein